MPNSHTYTHAFHYKITNFGGVFAARNFENRVKFKKKVSEVMYTLCVQHILAFFFTFETIFEFSSRKNSPKFDDFSLSVLGYK